MMQVTKPGQLSLAVLASGRGSNFDAICAAIDRHDLNAEIKVLISNKKAAPVLQKAEQRGIKTFFINPGAYANREEYETELVKHLNGYQVDLVVLAGYMRLVGKTLLDAYKHKVVNIHPALLPAFIGLHAQKQAVEYGVKFSGCTVHMVDEGMDSGPIIMQAVVPVYQDDDEDSLAARILVEEHKIYAQSLQLFAEGRIWIDGRKVIIR
ncbi:MAG: phosphoribosylglycinamide formyltransferase [Syntrophomonadaceae bacterium]|nr:phosphoribosylglycinamide formyltransferase [Syntrophomonadaceae bacterium]MDD4548349.1 phosphoribosylglycinamide formyltransferase [Syntrophomonadaceae bacterium]